MLSISARLPVCGIACEDSLDSEGKIRPNTNPFHSMYIQVGPEFIAIYLSTLTLRLGMRSLKKKAPVTIDLTIAHNKIAKAELTFF